MLLSNIHILGREEPESLLVEKGRIRDIFSTGKPVSAGATETPIDMEGALAFPGLINSHDHLDFNLFPQIRNRTYHNYIEWAGDIQTQNRQQIARVLKIPEQLRVKWGIYKNLLTGITTVVNHGKKIPVEQPPIRVFQECQSIHSVRSDRYWKLHLNRLMKRNEPAVIHIGEGTDPFAKSEIRRLLKWNLVRRKIIGVHAIAMEEKEAASFSALVWCPASNYFLYGKTAPIHQLLGRTSIVFGTDSTLTASWNIWEHLRLARNTGFVPDEALFDMLTLQPARVWGLGPTGQLKMDQQADLVIAKPGSSAEKWDAFFGLNPENILLILQSGNIRLFDAAVLEKVKKHITINEFSRIYLNGTTKYATGNIPALLGEIRKYYPEVRFPVQADE